MNDERRSEALDPDDDPSPEESSSLHFLDDEPPAADPAPAASEAPPADADAGASLEFVASGEPGDEPGEEPPPDVQEELDVGADAAPGEDRPALERAREARAAAAEIDDEAYRALWRDVLLCPLRGGTLLGLVLLGLLTAWMSSLEGGATYDDRYQNSLLQGVIGVVALLVIGLYARRIMVCTFPVERPVPWFRDPEDDATALSASLDFITIVGLVSAPLMVVMTVTAFVDWPGWLEWMLRLAAALLAAAQLPFALVGAVGRGTVLGALPRTVVRIVKAEPRATKIAAGSALAFAGLFVLSFLLSTLYAPEKANANLGEADTTALRSAGRVGLFLMRFVAAWAALVSFRVAGLLARDVPEVREILE